MNSLRRQLAENLAIARDQARPRQERPLVPNDVLFPATKLSYLANVLNQKAAAFYRRHQVLEIEPAAESGLDLAGRTVMTTRYCLKYELGLCPRQKEFTTESTESTGGTEEGRVRTQDSEPLSPPTSVPSALAVVNIRPPEPWFLADDEGRRLRLRFRCDERHCVMEVVYNA